MLVFLALGNVKVLSFALGDAKVPNANDFASQWNIGSSIQYCALLRYSVHRTGQMHGHNYTRIVVVASDYSRCLLYSSHDTLKL